MESALWLKWAESLSCSKATRLSLSSWEHCQNYCLLYESLTHGFIQQTLLSRALSEFPQGFLPFDGKVAIPSFCPLVKATCTFCQKTSKLEREPSQPVHTLQAMSMCPDHMGAVKAAGLLWLKHAQQPARALPYLQQLAQKESQPGASKSSSSGWKAQQLLADCLL